jgi:hypothetical protein
MNDLTLSSTVARYAAVGVAAGRLLAAGLPVEFDALSIGYAGGQFALIPLDESGHDNAVRIVACVNACEGMAYPEGAVAGLRAYIERLRAEVGVLRGALASLVLDADCDHNREQGDAHRDVTVRNIERARAALAGGK